MFIIFYYQAVIGIPIFVILIPTSIVRLVVPFLQPLLGSISDRNYKFTRNKGRRFLWLMVFGFQIPIFFVLLFFSKNLVIFAIRGTHILYKNNCWLSSKFRDCSPHQSLYNLTRKYPAVGYYSYTKRCASFL